ncbi:DNA-formamidopyrimidine glycosylase family protein [Jatrophihabitans sp. DSM 45814]
MPEGDTVFITAQRLRVALAGRLVTQFELRVPALALADQGGTTLDEVQPIGKHLLMRFSDGRTLHSHLRMDGAWRVAGVGKRRASAGPEHTIRAIVGNAQATAIGYRVHDLALVDTQNEAELVGHLGPDLLDPRFDLGEALRRFSANADLSIGDALLDQRLTAGLGNVYKSELMFLHQLDPWQTVAETTGLEVILTDAVRLLRANIGRFNRSTTGWTQPGQQYFVYGRKGLACRRCGTRIRQAEQGSAATERVLYYCPSCQPVADRH